MSSPPRTIETADERRRRLARQLRLTSVEAFHDQLCAAGVTRAFAGYENGTFTLSHPRLLAPVAALFELSQDFARHEGVWIGREDGIPTIFLACVHDTRRGLAQGGVRFKPYDDLAELLLDGLRLARGMTRKNALAGLHWGGGKGIVPLTRALFEDPDVRREGSPRRLELFRAYGRFIASLGGLYYTAEDVGTRTSDLDAIFSQNRFTTCISPAKGGSGNPSTATALGVFRALQAAWRTLTGSDRLAGVRVSVQGIGNVGGPLVDALRAASARVWITDVDAPLVEQFCRERPDVTAVAPEVIFDVDADVFAPCAIGAQVNARTIPRLRVRLVCGAANNILAEPADARRLADRGILFVPDYLANRMGITQCADEWHGVLASDVALAAERVYPDTLRVLKHARTRAITPSDAAEELADAAACELHPLLGHRGRRLADHLAANGWSRECGERSQEPRPRIAPAFDPGTDEPAIRRRFEREDLASGGGRILAAAPVSTAGRPNLATLLPALLMDVEARAAAMIGRSRPRCRVGSDPDGHRLELAVERTLPEERPGVGQGWFTARCRDHHRRNDAAAREQLAFLGVGCAPDSWLDAMGDDAGASVRLLLAALAGAGLLEAEGAGLTLRLERAARRFEELVAQEEILIRDVADGSTERWRRQVVALAGAHRRWRVTRAGDWGHPAPENAPGTVLVTGLALVATTLDATGWPRELEPIADVFTDPPLLARWVVPAQLVSLAIAGRPAFRRVHVHGTLHAVERRLLPWTGAPAEARGDEERFIARYRRRAIRHRVDDVVEPSTLIERFGADALRLGCLLSLHGGGRTTAAESHLRRARRTIRRLVAAVTVIFSLPPADGVPGGAAPEAEHLRQRTATLHAAARQAYAEQRPAVVARLFPEAVGELSRYAAAAAAAPRSPAAIAALRVTVAALVEQLGEAFTPICPFVFVRLGEWIEGRV